MKGHCGVYEVGSTTFSPDVTLYLAHTVILEAKKHHLPFPTSRWSHAGRWWKCGNGAAVILILTNPLEIKSSAVNGLLRAFCDAASDLVWVHHKMATTFYLLTFILSSLLL